MFVLLGIESARAGPGKAVVTQLVPVPVDEVKPLPPPVKKCRLLKNVETSTAYGSGVSIPAQFIQSGCCCVTTLGLFVQGVNTPSTITETKLITTNLVCED